MAIIRQNSISGINSITAQSNAVEFYEVDGTRLTIGADVNGNVTGDVTGDITANQITVGDSFIKPSQVGLGTTTTAGRDAGISTAIGTLIYNSTSNEVQAYGPLGWVTVKNTISTGIEASGGVVNDYAHDGKLYRSHTFTGTGSLVVTSLSSGGIPSNVDYLIVGGGGGGGGRHAGGGGAGGYQEGSKVVEAVTYPVVVGSGGNGAFTGSTSWSPMVGYSGSPTSIFNITSTGGGYGGGYNPGTGTPGGPGGSGGGGQNTASGGTGIPGQGFPGGLSNGSSPSYGGGGGGGAAAAGGDGASNLGGLGGIGKQSSIASGISTYYAGGGGGGSFEGPAAKAGLGGNGGGGNGGAGPEDALHGTESTGGGGGGGGGGGQAGRNGGSGVVVVRYEIGDSQTKTAKATGGSVTYYDGKTIHAFLASGTFSTPSSFSETCEYVIIGGGGCGGFYNYRGGGGGAGTYKTGNTPVSGSNNINVVIGGGGAHFGAYGPGTNGNGNASSISFPSTITAPGGGMGGSWPNNAGTNGGSGGGAGGGPGTGTDRFGVATGDPFPGTIGNTPSNGWGHNGGACAINQQQGAGGGGAGQVGYPNGPTSSTPTRGLGGAGVQMPATFRSPGNVYGTPGPNPGGYYVGGGGNGGGYPPAGNPAVESTQPVGGGGYGVMDANAPTYDGAGGPGLIHTGSGGGGTNMADTSPASGEDAVGGRGGSGLVLIAYPT